MRGKEERRSSKKKGKQGSSGAKMAGQIMAPQAMRSAMGRALDRGLKQEDKDKQYDAQFNAIATVLSTAFSIWLPSQMIIGVLGKGPIPTFAPPVVPVGPVSTFNKVLFRLIYLK